MCLDLCLLSTNHKQALVSWMQTILSNPKLCVAITAQSFHTKSNSRFEWYALRLVASGGGGVGGV